MHRARPLGRARRIVRSTLPAALLAVVLASSAGFQASGTRQTSAWLDRTITIDGSDKDWAGQTTPIKGSFISLGFANDGDWLYMCVQARHEPVRLQLASAGLIVWLDPERGSGNAYGIRFPSAGAMSVLGEPPADQPANWPDTIDVLGPGRKQSRTVSLAESGGIQVRCGLHDDVFVYELKVPLQRTGAHPYAVGAEPGQLVRASIETPEYRGPFPRSPYLPGGWFGFPIASRPAVSAGTLGALPVIGLPVVPRPISVQTTVQLSTR